MKKILEAKDKKNNIDETINTLIILATFKSLNEQLYNLKGTHSGIVKKRFNLVLNTFKMYENVIDEDYLKQNKVFINQLYDAITDMIYMLKEDVIKKGNYENS
tara:strand:+ start:5602 stop:5910 length:309 start_codon:yes stop_codon:yes gene_type:complete